MSDDDEYLPLSWLSQADYCLRRAALLMNERIWAESADTAKGRAEHERVHDQRVERRGDQIKLFEYAVFSDSLMLSGKCDCIEAVRAQEGCILPAADFPVSLRPVEYKHGSVRSEIEYEIQLCAQAMCLEQMFGASIMCGDIFYITAHRRLEVEFTPALRQMVRDTAAKLWSVRNSLTVPEAKFGSRCKRCSLAGYCMPKTNRSAEEYCRMLEKEAREADAI